MKLLVLLILVFNISTPAFAESKCEGLECLLCEELTNEEHYKEGIMKAMRFIAPGKDSWLFRSDFDLSNEFGIPRSFLEDYNRLITTFNDQGTEVVFVVQPTRGLMNPSKVRADLAYGFNFDLAKNNLSLFLDQLRTGGAHVPDSIALLDRTNKPEYFFRRDHHWTPTGSKETAKLVADYIKQLSVYSDLSNKQYVTEESTVLPKDGTMNRALRLICGNNFGSQYSQGYQTVPVSSDEDALFGDVEDPEVVLVGTSNTADRDDDYKNYNFNGFLKEFLEVDILNYALPGAGQDGALLQYLLSDEYDSSNPPKILVWELPASYKLDDEKIYRQLIPAINGACENTDVILERSHSLGPMKKADRVEVLSNTGKLRKSFTNRDSFLQLDFSNKKLKDFYVITYYDNGERDKVWFRRAGIVDGGRYLLELSNEDRFDSAKLMSVFIEPSEEFIESTDLTVQLCQ